MRAGRIVTIAALGAQLGFAQLSFLRRDLSLTARHQYAGLPFFLSTADFNGDRLPDLATVSPSGISILLNQGDGEFSAAKHSPFGVPGPGIAGDFNGDGRIDLLSAGYWRPDGALLPGRGDGTFAPSKPLPGLGWPAVAGDFNRDGRIDVACLDRTTGTFGILLGNGDGTFRRTNQAGLLFWPAALATGDFDRDGNLDVAALGSSPNGSGIFVFPSLGDGTTKSAVFSPAQNPWIAPGQARAVLLADDFDGDGFLDLVTESALLAGKGDGTFHSRANSDTNRSEEKPPRGLSLAAADFDRDQRVDLVRANDSLYYADNTVSIFRGRADGTAGLPTQSVTGWGPSEVVTADLDGDGRPDIATLNRIANTITVLLNRSAAEPSLTRAVSAASGTAIVAPGSIATLYANVPGAVTEQAAGLAWPEQLGGISLEIRDADGGSHRAHLIYVSETQINFRIPEQTAIGEALLVAIHGAVSTQVGTLQVEEVAPAVVQVRSWSMTPLAYDIRADPEGRSSTTPVFTCDSSGDCEPVPIDPSPSGSSLVLLVTGFRHATVANVKCTISNQAIDVEFVGEHTIRGLQEIRVRIPPVEWEFWEIPDGRVHLSIDGVVANMVQMNFRYPVRESWW